MDTETANYVIGILERIANALEDISERTRKLAEPTEDEIKARLEKSMALAMLLGMSRGDSDSLN